MNNPDDMRLILQAYTSIGYMWRIDFRNNGIQVRFIEQTTDTKVIDYEIIP